MVDIMAFGAHPDDIEFGCGGLLCRQFALGHSIVMVDLTAGQKGTHGTPEQRRKEGQAAAQIIGAKRIVLDLQDCEVQDTPEARLAVVQAIRTHKPKLLLAQNWKSTIQHPDHVAAGRIVQAAARLARFKNILPEIPIHRVDGILYYPGPMCEHTDYLVDISDYVEQWKQLILAHESQHQTFDYLNRCLASAARWGAMMGTKYAQNLVAHNPIVVNNVMQVSKGTIEL